MFSVVYSTAGTEEEAERIARALVEERLAACVNIHPIQSIYRWRGEVEEDAEYALSIKTTSDKTSIIEERIRELHTYDLPAIITYTVEGGLSEYLDWIRESVEE